PPPPLSLHDALPIYGVARRPRNLRDDHALAPQQRVHETRLADVRAAEDRDADRVVGQLGGPTRAVRLEVDEDLVEQVAGAVAVQDRKSTRLNSSHLG